MQFLLITNCSATKTAPARRLLRARSLTKGTVTQLAEQWRGRLTQSPPGVIARELYSGRAFSLAAGAAERHRSPLFIASAGMGLVGAETRLAPYSLSVSPGGRDCVLDRASPDRAFSSTDWWSALQALYVGSSTLHRVLRQHPSALCVIAVTRPYLKMLEEDLSAVPERDIERLRLVGVGAGFNLPGCIRDCVMPYDARLNDQRCGSSGTQFDFAARALIHFVDLVRADRRLLSPAAHATRVRRSLSRYRAPVRPKRQRVNDALLLRRVLQLKRMQMSRTSALAYLRNDLALACEVHRFSAIWRVVEMRSHG